MTFLHCRDNFRIPVAQIVEVVGIYQDPDQKAFKPDMHEARGQE